MIYGSLRFNHIKNGVFSKPSEEFFDINTITLIFSQLIRNGVESLDFLISKRNDRHSGFLFEEISVEKGFQSRTEQILVHPRQFDKLSEFRIFKIPNQCSIILSVNHISGIFIIHFILSHSMFHFHHEFSMLVLISNSRMWLDSTSISTVIGILIIHIGSKLNKTGVHSCIDQISFYPLSLIERHILCTLLMYCGLHLHEVQSFGRFVYSLR